MRPLDPLELPLSGVRLIEANAGTGKTFTITTLFLRLLLERGLEVPRILVVTYTNAATAQLRSKVRARIAGETAPLLFTALNSQFWSTDITQPISTLTVQVFAYAISPYEDWHRQAWAGALVLVSLVLLCSLLARVATARMEKLQRGG